MKLFNYGIILAVTFFIIGCSSFGHLEPDYEKIADNITEKTAKKLKEQKNLSLVGIGGKMMNDIQAMDMSFEFYQEIDLIQARKLIVCVIYEYLSDINSSKELKPYLHEYPFTAKNIEIRIWIYNSDKSRLPAENIYYISSINGMLEYYIRSEPHQPVYEETYEDALKIVNSCR